MNEGDNPPIGIILCADKSDSVVNTLYPKMKNKYLPLNINYICLVKKNY